MDELSLCNKNFTPICLKTLYNFANYEQKSSDQNNYGIAEFSPNTYVQSDLDMFLSTFEPNSTGIKLVIRFIDSAVFFTDRSFDSNAESKLDLQYAISLIYPTPVTSYQVGDPVIGGLDSFLDVINSFYCTYNGRDDPKYGVIYPNSYNITGAYNGSADCGKYNGTNVISISYGFYEPNASPAYE